MTLSIAASKSVAKHKPLTNRERQIAALYKRMLNAQARASTQYELADRLAYQLAKEIKQHGVLPSGTVRITPDGRGLQVIDAYEQAKVKAKELSNPMPKCWAHGAVRQYEFKEIAAESD